VSAFYSGLVAMEIGLDQRAEAELLEATRLVRQEPAAWANLGLLALRRNEFAVAAERLATARSLAPENADIEVLLGQLESNRGRLEASVEHYRRAVELDPTNLKAMYALAQEMERRGDPETEIWLNRILEIDPLNAAVLVEMARLAARGEDGETLQSTVRRLAELTAGWSPEVNEQLERLQAAASIPDYVAAATQSAFLRNVLLSVQAYRDALALVQTPAARAGEPMERFLLLEEPRATPAPPDESLSFAAEPLLPSDEAMWAWVGAVSLSGDQEPTVLVADGQRVQVVGAEGLPFPGGASALSPSLDGVVSLDFDYDFRMDLALAGAGGLRLFQQNGDGVFSDVTGSTALSTSVLDAPYRSAWAADFDLEGDIDIVLGAASAPPRVLRNNGDGTFAALPLFESIDGLSGFAWADLDADGDPDAALLDGAGNLHVFSHERGAGFLEQTVPAELTAAIAITAGDAEGDGTIDVIMLTAAGSIQKLSTGAQGEGW
jgi:Tfp pilus assembly protein PilF